MKQTMAIFTVLTLGLAIASAQDSTADKKMDSKMTVTGCLSQGSSDSEYNIRDQSGKTYGLMGSTVNLKPHVGHEVSITGTSAKAAASTNNANSTGENLQVTSLKMVSTTCK